MDAADYRPLSEKERELLVWLLEHGPIDAVNFLPQLDIIEARSSCNCGCPSIEFERSGGCTIHSLAARHASALPGAIRWRRSGFDADCGEWRSFWT